MELLMVITYSASVRCWTETWLQWGHAQLFIDFKKVCASDGTEIFYIIL